MKNKLVLLILSLLGLPGCGKESPDAYGCPYSTYKIDGRVTDAAGNPIANILVKHSEYYDGVRTDAEGAYLLTGQDYWSVDSLYFSDTDGSANGGRFARKAVKTDMSKAVQTGKGDGNWYQGEYTLTVDVALENQPNDGKSS